MTTETIVQFSRTRSSDIADGTARRDCVKPSVSTARSAYSVSSSATGRSGEVYLEVAMDVPASVAAQIIELLADSQS